MVCIDPASTILGQKGVNMVKIREIWPEIPTFGKNIDEQIEINSHYSGYMGEAKKQIYWHLKEMKIYLSLKILIMKKLSGPFK